MDDQAQPAPSRTAFLSAAAAGTALVAAMSQPANAAANANQAALDPVLHRPAKHKQVIAASKLNGGAALRYAGNSLNAIQFAYDGGPNALHVACVFYGTSLFFAANDALWARYSLFDVLDTAGDALPMLVHSPQNPFLHARSSLHVTDAPDDPHGFYHDFTVAALSRRGVSWIVCNNALTEITRQIAGLQKTSPEAVYADFRRNLVPGALVVPAGVAAIILAQEAGFTFLPG